MQQLTPLITTYIYEERYAALINISNVQQLPSLRRLLQKLVGITPVIKSKISAVTKKSQHANHAVTGIHNSHQL